MNIASRNIYRTSRERAPDSRDAVTKCISMCSLMVKTHDGKAENKCKFMLILYIGIPSKLINMNVPSIHTHTHHTAARCCRVVVLVVAVHTV